MSPGLQFISPPSDTEDPDIPQPQYGEFPKHEEETKLDDDVVVVRHRVVTGVDGKRKETVVETLPKQPTEKENSTTYYLLMGGLFLGLAWMLVDP